MNKVIDISRDNLPFISIIMPIRDEAGFIEQSLKAVLKQDYAHERMEVVIVDGMSEDGTRKIVQRIISELKDHSPRLFFLDNPSHVVPIALNIGLRQAQGEIIMRIDGHCEIAPDYVRRCVELFQNIKADCVGGVMKTIGKTFIAQSVALAQSSFFGVGGVAFRTGRKIPGYVDTVAFGAYQRGVFERIGNFDEELVRNQDDEFNFRLIKSGGKIWLDPAIRSTYYSRANLRSLWRQYFQYGFWKVRVIQKRGAIPSLRHIVPLLFVLGILGSLLISIVTRKHLFSLTIIGSYIIINICMSIWESRKNCKTIVLLPISFFIIHFSYGIGFLFGLWRWRKF